MSTSKIIHLSGDNYQKHRWGASAIAQALRDLSRGNTKTEEFSLGRTIKDHQLEELETFSISIDWTARRYCCKTASDYEQILYGIDCDQIADASAELSVVFCAKLDELKKRHQKAGDRPVAWQWVRRTSLPYTTEEFLNQAGTLPKVGMPIYWKVGSKHGEDGHGYIAALEPNRSSEWILIQDTPLDAKETAQFAESLRKVAAASNGLFDWVIDVDNVSWSSLDILMRINAFGNLQSFTLADEDAREKIAAIQGSHDG